MRKKTVFLQKKAMCKRTAALLLALLMVVSLAGCGKAADSGDGKTADQGDVNQPKLSGTLKVVTTSETYQPLFDQFKKDTGVDVEFLSMSSGEVLSKAKAEGGTPMADLWFGGGIDAFMQAKTDGLLQQADFDGSDKLAPEFKDPEGYWFSKGITIVGFLVNDDIIKEKNLPVPATWDDLTNPVYKDEILMSNPAVSGTNYAVVNALLQTKGDKAGWDYFKKLNQNVLYYSKRGKDPSTKTAAGEAAIGITYLDGTIDKLAKEQNVTIVYPKDGIPYVPEGVAVFKNAANTDAAKYFLKWLFNSDQHLKQLADIDQKAAVKLIKPSMEGLEAPYDVNRLMKEDLSLFGADRTKILDQWNALIGDKAQAD